MPHKVRFQPFLRIDKLEIRADHFELYGFFCFNRACQLNYFGFDIPRFNFPVLNHISKSRFFIRTLNQIRKLRLRLCDNTLGFFYGIPLFTEKCIYHDGLRKQPAFPSGDLHFTLILSLRNFFLDIVCRSGVGVAIRFAYDK